MKTIGVVTLFAGNYGSTLQSYAMKKTIEDMGYRCEIIHHERKDFEIFTGRIQTLLSLIVNSVKFPDYFYAFLSMRESAKFSKSSLSIKSSKALELFVKRSLQPKGYSKKQLKRIGRDDNYLYFIAGSDQIWNGSIPYQSERFLEFVPKDKRIAYAPSFGTGSIAKYNKKKFQKSIKKFRKLSVREDQGKEMIKELIGREVERMPDPTVLLTCEDWLEFSKSSKKNEEPYIFIHFLDKPNKEALTAIKKANQHYKCKTIVFAYPHMEISNLLGSKCEYRDGMPEDYVSLIQSAKCVLTDSFHTTLFSLRFQKQLFVFERQYTHGVSQESRITSLLNNCHCLYCLINESNINKFDGLLKESGCDCDEFFLKEREKGIRFLQEVLLDCSINKQVTPLLRTIDECTGCGVCEIVCPKGAITMQKGEFGSCAPLINAEQCVKCGICEKVCKIIPKRDIQNQRCYIAYNTNDEMLQKSASGGVFSTLAYEVLKSGGVVYGAKMLYMDEGVIVKHVAVENTSDLYQVLKSKYVQSSCKEVFPDIKAKLKEGKVVLFGGTSCQIEALYRFLGKSWFKNLYTIDLICHGVPGEMLFAEYTKYLQEKTNSKIIDFSFREKSRNGIEFIEKITYQNGVVSKCECKNSAYYKMFLHGDSYRESCYHCKYASIMKPADITIGDYFEAKNDYPEFFGEGGLLNNIKGLSCLIVNNEHGHQLIKRYGINLKCLGADIEKAQNSHNQLCFPNIKTDQREKFIKLYNRNGWNEILKYEKRCRCLLYVPKKIYRIIRGRKN